MNGIDFPVETKPLFLEGGQEITDRKAVVRTDTNNVLGIVSNNYRIVPHREVVDAFNRTDILLPSKFNLCKNGAILFAHYNVRDNGSVKSASVAPGDIVNFGIRVFNSYNQQFGVGFEVVANRLVCSNGLVVPRAVSRMSFKHFDNVNIDKFRELIDRRLGHIPSTVETWRRWSETKPDANRVRTFFDNLSIGQKDRERLLEDALAKKDQDGVWGIFNVMTEYVTHHLKVVNEANRMLSVRSREQSILQKFYNFVWN